ncbi:hypothetical protein C482_05251 [Natrialba chahannaoensis JCM 10990]|uniref:DUF4157 domain-containing protein n=1 Tax=Natrialba chahannaoensis JCM 10990 TaxID=1227492 RepID=M0AWP1_9EURY|nr:hypothetical protein C482_05251 [Natrialba chahannaoensis JCM 10990]
MDADFSNVRIHTGEKAAEAAEQAFAGEDSVVVTGLVLGQLAVLSDRFLDGVVRGDWRVSLERESRPFGGVRSHQSVNILTFFTIA